MTPPDNTAAIDFEIVSQQGPPVLQSTDVAGRRLVLILHNRGAADLPLKGGPPVGEGVITPKGPTSLYVTLGGLTATITPPNGWLAQNLQEGGIKHWALTPQADTTLSASASVSFTIVDIQVPKTVTSASLTVDYRNVPGVSDDSTQMPLLVGSDSRSLPILVELGARDVVYVSPDGVPAITNELSLHLTNALPGRPLVAADAPRQSAEPVIYLSFVYGEAPGPGALTTTEHAANIRVDPSPASSKGWLVEPFLQGVPYWRLRPQHPEVLRAGESVEFTIGNIVSYLAPGLTAMFLQYGYFPQYGGGCVSLAVPKVAAPIVADLTADPDIAPPSIDSVDSVLAWRAVNARYVTFDRAIAGSALFPPEGQGPLKDPLTLRKGQQVTVTAHADGAATSRTIALRTLQRTSVTIPVGSLGAALIGTDVSRIYVPQTDMSSHFVAVLRSDDHTLLPTLDVLGPLNRAPDASTGMLASVLSPDRRTIYMVVSGSAGQGAWGLWLLALDVTSSKVSLVTPLGSVKDLRFAQLSFNTDGTIIYAASAGIVSSIHTVFVVDLAASRVLHTCSFSSGLGSGDLWVIATAPAGRFAYVVSLVGLRVVDLVNGTTVNFLRLVDVGKKPGVLAVASADATRIYALTLDAAPSPRLSVIRVDDADMQLVCQVPVPLTGPINMGIRTITLAPDGNLYLALYQDNLQIFDTTQLRLRTRVCGQNGNFSPTALCITHDGSTVYATSAGQSSAVLDILTWR